MSDPAPVSPPAHGAAFSRADVAKVCAVGQDRRLYRRRGVKAYLDERKALAEGADDPRFAALVHLRRHGSGGDRIV